jgi:elongation factor P
VIIVVSSNDFKTGLTIEKDGEIYSVIEFMHVKPGKGGAFVRSKLRNLRNGSIVDYTFNAGIKVNLAMIEKVEMQFIYADGDTYVFMNNETYEQLELNVSKIAYEKNFLAVGLVVNIQIYKAKSGDEILGVILPDKVVLEVVDSGFGVKIEGKTNPMKECVLETGYTVKCPIFIESGERIIVSTLTGEYVSREK